MSRRLTSCLLVTFVLLLVVIGGCTKPAKETGVLEIKLTVPEQLLGAEGVGPMEAPVVSYFKFTITKGSAVYAKTVPVTGGEVSVSFDKLAPGVWTIVVNGYSASDVIICTGSTTATVEAGKTATANVVISLAKGDLTVRVVFPEGVTPATGTVILIDPINGNLTEDLVMGMGQGEAEFTAITSKTWPIRVILYDGVGAELLQGESQVFVSPGVDTLAVVTFTDGGIAITITWDLPPSKPTGVTAIAGTGKVTVSWNANPAEEGVVGYLVYRADRADQSPYLLNDTLVTDTSYEDTGITIKSGTYYYYVQAFNADGLSSELSEPVSTIMINVASPINVFLSVGSASNSTSIRKMPFISDFYSITQGVNRMKVFRSASPGGPFEYYKDASFSEGRWAFSDVTVRPEETYYYKLSALVGDFESDLCAETLKFTLAPNLDLQYPAAGSILPLSTEMYFSWNTVFDYDEFYIWTFKKNDSGDYVVYHVYKGDIPMGTSYIPSKEYIEGDYYWCVMGQWQSADRLEAIGVGSVFTYFSIR